jgi:hypothetical protein
MTVKGKVIEVLKVTELRDQGEEKIIQAMLQTLHRLEAKRKPFMSNK